MDISNNTVEECVHEIVVDYIDIDPDRTQQIIYCEKCMFTFTSLNTTISNDGL
jgi:hypothetical protein